MTPQNEPKSHTPGLFFKLLAGSLLVVSAVLGLGFAKWCRSTCYEETTAPTAPRKTSLTLPKDLCKDWPKPDCVLLLSAQLHGYLKPCGCSEKQHGGLERRYNLVQILNDRGWEVVAADLGDIPQSEGPAKLPNIQGPLKYVYAMKALKATNYTAVGIGEYEAKMRLEVPLAEYALNNPQPRVLAANLTNRDDEYPPPLVDTWQLAAMKTTEVKVGFTSIVGAIVAEQKIKKVDPKPKFGDASEALQSVLKAMDEKKVDVRVLLYQGYATLMNKPGQPPEAIACAKAFPQFPVMLCLSEEDEPPVDPIWVDQGKDKPKTLLARLGHKGKFVGLVGVYKTGKPAQPFEFRYQLVDLSEEFLTPKTEQATHPIATLLEDYQLQLKNDKYLARFGQTKHPLQVAVPGIVPDYAGTDACKKCHEWAYKVWKDSKHSHAYETLVDTQRKNPPGNRQYDAECIVCHTVGFGYQTGFKDLEKTPKLINVGCESCHGPASEHVKNPNNKQWSALLNPWKAPEKETPKEKEKRLFLTDQMCQRCHDSENDVTWTHGGFERKWPAVKHYDEDAK